MTLYSKLSDCFESNFTWIACAAGGGNAPQFIDRKLKGTGNLIGVPKTHAVPSLHTPNCIEWSAGDPGEFIQSPFILFAQIVDVALQRG